MLLIIADSHIKYYNQIEQLPQVKNFLTGKLMDLDYFGDWGHLINPLVYWNGFYIQPFRITYLLDLIKERKVFHNEKFITDINEISEYIYAYKEGFVLGYEKFDSIEIENKSSVFKSDKLSIEKIINYIEDHKESDNGGFTFHSYTESKQFFRGKTKCVFKQQNGTCSERKGNQLKNVCEWCDLKTLTDLNKWKSKGYEGGKYYRAWFIVLANYQIFDEYFKTMKSLPPQQTETKTSKLRVNQIALIHVYEGNQITRENAPEIAAKYGYTSKYSGEGLFQDYTFFCSPANRKAEPKLCTPKTLQNKIRLFESIIEHLTDKVKQRAIDEISILKTIYEGEYQ